MTVHGEESPTRDAKQSVREGNESQDTEMFLPFPAHGSIYTDMSKPIPLSLGLLKYNESLKDYVIANEKSISRYGYEDPVTYNNRGNAYAGLGEWDQAVEVRLLRRTSERTKTQF